MKLHITQKIGLVGIAFIAFIALLLHFGDVFSPFIFSAWIPFTVLILIGYSIKSRKRKYQA